MIILLTMKPYISHRDATLASELLKENNVKMAHYHSLCLNDITRIKTMFLFAMSALQHSLLELAQRLKVQLPANQLASLPIDIGLTNLAISI